MWEHGTRKPINIYAAEAVKGSVQFFNWPVISAVRREGNDWRHSGSCSEKRQGLSECLSLAPKLKTNWSSR